MSETPAHYELCVAGNNVEVDDITEALSHKMRAGIKGVGASQLIAGHYARHKYFAAVEYLLRAPFKGQEKDDLRKCIAVIQSMIDAPQYQ